jgi:mannitol-1-phosphate 5-dehydrogenase
LKVQNFLKQQRLNNMPVKKTVVQFGAGAIGKGFLGQLWTQAGYEVIFVDVQEQTIATLNQEKCYPLTLVESTHTQMLTISPVRALHAIKDRVAILEELTHCTFATTAVGANALAGIGSDFLAHLTDRTRPLSVFVCENGADAPTKLAETAGGNCQILPTIVSRMVSASGSEPYSTLPYFAPEAMQNIPNIPNCVRETAPQRWSGLYTRKLLTHNGGHAALAYHGLLKSKTTIPDCLTDAELIAELRGFWAEVHAAQCAESGFTNDEMQAHESDLFHRFQNRALGDTCERVARDPMRKLGGEERFIKAALLCLKHQIAPVYICRAIHAALQHPDIVPMVMMLGRQKTLCKLANLKEDHPLMEQFQ